MTRHFQTSSVLFLCVLCAGCYGRQLVREPIVVEENAGEIALIREKQRLTDERLEQLERLNAEQMEILRALRAEGSTDREEILIRIDALAEVSTESSARAGRLDGKMDRIIHKMNRVPVTPMEKAEGDSTVSFLEPKPLYDAAYLDLVRGNYQAARAGFDAYLQAFPGNALSDDALYWMGECFLAEGTPGEALRRFDRLERDYPESERIPPALLKMAECYRELGDKGEARKILTRLVDEYPSTVEAPLAREQLAAD